MGLCSIKPMKLKENKKTMMNTQKARKTEFLLKTLEKLYDRYIRDGPLKRFPLSTFQHAYRPGRSCETALHQLVSRNGKSLFYKESSLFLDIEGAFNKLQFEVVKRAALRHGLQPTVICWLLSLLRCRLLTISINEANVKALAIQGCPQGGVLSPLMWSMAVDDLLNLLGRSDIFAQAYADDVVVSVAGKFTERIK